MLNSGSGFDLRMNWEKIQHKQKKNYRDKFHPGFHDFWQQVPFASSLWSTPADECQRESELFTVEDLPAAWLLQVQGLPMQGLPQ